MTVLWCFDILPPHPLPLATHEKPSTRLNAIVDLAEWRGKKPASDENQITWVFLAKCAMFDKSNNDADDVIVDVSFLSLVTLFPTRCWSNQYFISVAFDKIIFHIFRASFYGTIVFVKRTLFFSSFEASPWVREVENLMTAILFRCSTLRRGKVFRLCSKMCILASNDK